MNYDKYINLIAEKQFEAATKYKNSFIPDIVYKYYWLDELELSFVRVKIKYMWNMR